jgi:hypothetical protein
MYNCNTIDLAAMPEKNAFGVQQDVRLSDNRILPRCSEVAGEPEKTFATTGRKGKFAPIYRGSFCGTKTQTCCLPVNPII